MTQNMLTGRNFAMNVNSANPRAAADTTARGSASAKRHGMFGFRMMELTVVIAIITILLGLAAGRYQRSLLRSREAVLHQDLRVMRDAIQQYTLDKEAAPQSLTDLKDAGYLPQVPVDPITQQRDWVTVSEDILLSPEQTTVGISDVHSASNETSPFENTAYSSW